MDILKLENTTKIRCKERKYRKNTEIKTSVHGLNSRIEMREGLLSELRYGKTEINLSNRERTELKKKKKKEQSLRDLWDYNKIFLIYWHSRRIVEKVLEK